ncbi:hypothetical protein [Elizabethkingia meningoseptica]|uniref:Uncharacterized protein n=2 Tax=Elizabethkingia TaxID=308865 RepID=A0A1T3F4B8_ELIME|nr:hypothetical protein [Elizabethkingia meningoseptica]AQX11207.1 hypothetical protein BBD35_01905 [Elizabethkingia meningoseptica]OOH98102.1 hypothetical protein BMF97_02205 [Elizabethkingia meningoseptica]OPB72596.1 hypothetical protein BAY31_07845 [Elizabethkingia meningoseptica]
MKIAYRNYTRKKLINLALYASQNAKRISIALDIPFEIIKDEEIYQSLHGKMIKITSLNRVKANKKGLTKGSKIYINKNNLT